MSGGYVPYHLRHNKAVERAAFLELLKVVDRIYPVAEARYVGFAGPFFEDFKAIHSQLNVTKMTSLEIDSQVYARQLFNQPLSCIDIRQEAERDFINAFPLGDPERLVFWLDYASPRQAEEQMANFAKLCAKVAPGSIAKITLNASLNAVIADKTLDDLRNDDALPLTQQEKGERRLEKLRRRLSAIDLKCFSASDMTERKYPGILLYSLKEMIQRHMRKSGAYLQPLSSFLYQDGEHPMLTVTGIVLASSEGADAYARLGVEDWEFANTSWDEPPLQIKIPPLSYRERAQLDTHLPGGSTADLEKVLGFKLDPDERKHNDLLTSYVTFYRLFPYFARVSV